MPALARRPGLGTIQRFEGGDAPVLPKAANCIPGQSRAHTRTGRRARPDGDRDGDPRGARGRCIGMNNGAGSARVVLRDVRDERGTRHLGARRRDDGGIVIEGHDLGRGVEVLGPGLSEYEWVWTIAPDAVPSAIEAIGAQRVTTRCSCFSGGPLIAAARTQGTSNSPCRGRRLQSTAPFGLDIPAGEHDGSSPRSLTERPGRSSSGVKLYAAGLAR